MRETLSEDSQRHSISFSGASTHLNVHKRGVGAGVRRLLLLRLQLGDRPPAAARRVPQLGRLAVGPCREVQAAREAAAEEREGRNELHELSAVDEGRGSRRSGVGRDPGARREGAGRAPLGGGIVVAAGEGWGGGGVAGGAPLRLDAEGERALGHPRHLGQLGRRKHHLHVLLLVLLRLNRHLQPRQREHTNKTQFASPLRVQRYGGEVAGGVMSAAAAPACARSRFRSRAFSNTTASCLKRCAS